MTISRLACLFSVGLGVFGCGDESTGTGGGGAGGTLPSLVAEAGFIEVPAATVLGPNYASRMFFSFQPAEENPADAPLIVFFNGGPGSATTNILLPYGTGPHRIDPAADITAPPIPNDASYTRFANLLYIDERMAGFSYGLLPDRAPDCIGGENYYLSDAGDYVLTLLRFLSAHPTLLDNPVVLAGESYGGTRAPMMLHLLQHYAVAPEMPVPELPDVHAALPWLREEVQAHFDRLTPSEKGRAREPDQVAAQFGWMLMIQPNFFGLQQFQLQDPLLHEDPDFDAFFLEAGVYDVYDVRRTVAEGQKIVDHSANVMRDPDALALMLGVSLDRIPGLAAKDRGAAFRRWEHNDRETSAIAESALFDALGELSTDDAYWQPFEPTCFPTFGDVATANTLLSVLKRTHVFITNARWDSVVYTEALPTVFEQASFTATVDMSSPEGAARPGVLRLESVDAPEIAIRFPTYEAGHEVTVSTPKELGEDLRAWLVSEGVIRSE